MADSSWMSLSHMPNVCRTLPDVLYHTGTMLLVRGGTFSDSARSQATVPPGSGAYISTAPKPRASSSARSACGVPARIGNVP